MGVGLRVVVGADVVVLVGAGVELVADGDDVVVAGEVVVAVVV